MSDNNVDIDAILQGLVQTYSGPGKGRKQCPECKKYVGARQHHCACGHEFTKADLKTKNHVAEANPEVVAFVYRVGKKTSDLVVDIPSGSCPVKLKDTDQDSISDWCDQLLWSGKTVCKIYTPNAMKYFLRETVGINDPEFKTVSQKVDQWRENL